MRVLTLCLALGKTRAELLASMDAREFALWTAYDTQFGLPDTNIHTAEICAAAVRPHTKRRVTKLHFLPPAYHPKPEFVSAKENHARFRALTAHLRKPTNGSDR